MLTVELTLVEDELGGTIDEDAETVLEEPSDDETETLPDEIDAEIELDSTDEPDVTALDEIPGEVVGTIELDSVEEPELTAPEELD